MLTIRNAVDFLTGNYVLNIAIVSWFTAQTLKIVIDFARTKRVHLGLLLSSGGMPSSHSSTVAGTAVAVGRIRGVQSVEFAVAIIFAIIVMYDAAGVRQQAGKQARILNYMMDHWHEITPQMFQKELKELIGHTQVEVLAGALLGVLL